MKECENDPEAKKGNNADMLAKCRAGLVDYQVVTMIIVIIIMIMVSMIIIIIAKC